MLFSTCKYAPEELFAGFGQEVCRLDPNPASFSCADSCAHPNLCGFAKAVIEEASARQAKELIFTDCCDAMRRTYDVLASQGLPFCYFLPLPHKTGEKEIFLFARELQTLAEAYGQYSGLSFSWKAAVRAARTRCRQTQREALGAAGDPVSRPLLAVMGAHGGKMLLEGVKKSFPGVCVEDKTCSGNRGYDEAFLEPFPECEEEFFVWYARLLLKGMTPCMRMLSVKERAEETDFPASAAGIIYHTIKFCDYYSFEYSDLTQKAPVPVLKIETDTTPQSSGQMKTRLEAFGETVGLGTSCAGKRAGKPDVSDQHEDKQERSVEGKSSRRDSMTKRASFVAGIDSGSTSTDVVIMNREGQILGSVIRPTGMSALGSAKEALKTVLEEAGLSKDDLAGIVSTGYGRDILEQIPGTLCRTITEISCHAKGASYLFPDIHTIIDIGGQDSKVIVVDKTGSVRNFVMNDKCAAGTGRFLEMQAKALGLSLQKMSEIGLSWKEEVQISSMCTVFAESEVVSLVAGDTPVADIVHGLNRSVAAKTASLVRRCKGEPAYCMTGGVSQNQGVVRCLEEALDAPVQISRQSQLCGAIGAALYGIENLL